MDLCMLLSFSRNYGVLEFSHKSSGGIKGLPSESWILCLFSGLVMNRLVTKLNRQATWTGFSNFGILLGS